ncbi:helix-turn-helix domain-containing protein [Cnuibacter sp. UC19_7]|uniref:helix-turn-helix domain-containing protein n=1 Tax=Cnuibacter sp. UC19_7 TaxID=3350166 RepID=UPI0036704BA4
MNESRIPALRRERGWTQERLAEESRVAVRTIQRLESGKDASLESLALIAGALGVSAGELFDRVEAPTFEQAVSGLQERQEQQARRDAVTAAWRRVFNAGGIVVGLAVIALISLQILPGVGIFIIAAYWVGGKALFEALHRLVLDPRLDRRFPLSSPSATKRWWHRHEDAVATETLDPRAR